MKKNSNDEGITLVALSITIVVMLILVTISINIGTDSINSTRLRGFYANLEIVQKRIDEIAANNESYIDEDTGEKVYIKLQGTAFSELGETQRTNLQNILAEEENGLEETNFRYFTQEQLKNILDLPDIEYDMFIDFDNRVVIAENGIEVNGKKYYILKTSTYFVNPETNKNVGNITGLTYVVKNYGADRYRIIVTPQNTIGDLNASGFLRYKESNSEYWETSDNLEMIVRRLNTNYDVEFKDKNGNSIIETIRVIQDVTYNELTQENILILDIEKIYVGS